MQKELIREKFIRRNQQLRSLLKQLEWAGGDVTYIGIPTTQILAENCMLQGIAENMGLYIGQSEEITNAD